MVSLLQCKAEDDDDKVEEVEEKARPLTAAPGKEAKKTQATLQFSKNHQNHHQCIINYHL